MNTPTIIEFKSSDMTELIAAIRDIRIEINSSLDDIKFLRANFPRFERDQDHSGASILMAKTSTAAANAASSRKMRSWPARTMSQAALLFSKWRSILSMRLAKLSTWLRN